MIYQDFIESNGNYLAILDRRAIGIELKESYYRQAVKNMADAMEHGTEQTLL